MKKTIQKENMPECARELILHASKQERNHAVVLALSGDLGAGKTTLTKEIASILGVVEHVSSPTFVIMKLYPLTQNSYGFKKLVHVDAYRLNSSKELFHLGWEELCADTNNLILVEWPECVPECIPDDAIRVVLSHVNEDSRTISF